VILAAKFKVWVCIQIREKLNMNKTSTTKSAVYRQLGTPIVLLGSSIKFDVEDVHFDSS
jgi:hypothetical protein